MKGNTFLVSLLVFTALAYIATAKLAVLSPQSVASKFDREEGIDFRVIQFGQTHFGAHFVGNLVLANPLDACGPLRPFRKGEDTGRDNLIAVVMSGGCQDSTKIRNVEQSGAKMVLLINDNEMLPQEHGSRQGYQNFNIPLVLIPRGDGDKLLEYMQRNTDPNSESIFVTLNFPKDLKKKTVNLDLWFSVSDKQGIHKFLDHLKEVIEDFGDSFVFTPHYVTWTCATCRLQGYSKSDNADCVSGGRYCSPDPDKEGPLTGKDVVLEDLRQMCIWRVSKSLWWSYINMFEEDCRNEPNMRQCGTEILGKTTILLQSQEITRCIESSWIKDSTGVAVEALNDNTLLKQEKELQTQFDVTSFPMLYINYKPYDGKLGKVHKVYREICKELDSDTPVCKKIRESHHGHHRHSVWSYMKDILIVVLVIALLGSIVVMCYRRIGKREYKQLSMEANNMVSNYFAMEDKEELQT